MRADKDKVFVMTLSFNAYPTTAVVLKAIKERYDRKNIILCVLDNGSTDPMREYHDKYQSDYDIYIRNEFNNGTMFAINQMIKVFRRESPCEWMIYHEGDAVPFSPFPSHTLQRLWACLHNKDPLPLVIGFSMGAWPRYPFEMEPLPNIAKFTSDLYRYPLALNYQQLPLPDPTECRYQIPDKEVDQLTGMDHQSKVEWNALMEGTDRPRQAIEGLGYVSTTISRSNPLWMSLAVHKQVWDILGYFDEADQHGDIDFYRRLRLVPGVDMGISGALQFFANDFKYNQKVYFDQARWKQLKLYQMRGALHRMSGELAKGGKLYRRSLYDPDDPVKFNPMYGEKTYKAWSEENLQFMKENANPDFKGRPSWLETTDPGYEKFKPILLGKLEYVGDHGRAAVVRKGELSS